MDSPRLPRVRRRRESRYRHAGRALTRSSGVRGRCPGGGGLTTPGEVEAYERMHALAVERMGEDVILRDLVRLYEGVLRDGAPIREFEECAILYAAEMHNRTPDKRG